MKNLFRECSIKENYTGSSSGNGSVAHVRPTLLQVKAKLLRKYNSQKNIHNYLIALENDQKQVDTKCRHNNMKKGMALDDLPIFTAF